MHVADRLLRDELVNRIDNTTFLPAGRIPWNAASCGAAEILGAGAVATTRSLAQLYGCRGLGGEPDGVRLLRSETLEPGRRALSRRGDSSGAGVG